MWCKSTLGQDFSVGTLIASCWEGAMAFFGGFSGAERANNSSVWCYNETVTPAIHTN